jgi:glutaminyl-peptide cyclotransferase
LYPTSRTNGKWLGFFLLTFWVVLTVGPVRALAVPSPAPNSVEPDLRFLEKEWKEFTKAPHPMGSARQKEYSRHLHKSLEKSGLKVELHTFAVDKPLLKKKTVEGINVIARRKGSENCLLSIGGHYDTKEFSDVVFVGANDGGSSTVLKLELARQLKKNRASFPRGSWGGCDLELFFFDGEEAFLPDWNDGQKLFGVQDNLYGSRRYVAERMQRKPDLLLLVDMIGHKNQKLFITQGSNQKAAETMVKVKGGVDISIVPLGIEDDHIPFAQVGVPFVHVIDWTNLAEWHTPKDTLEIVSTSKLSEALKMVWRFLHEPRA